MTVFILRRLLAALPVLLAITLITFGLLKRTPGDPILSIVGERADEKAMQNLASQLGIGDSLWTQYKKYLTGILKGDLGDSFRSKRPVLSEFLERFPNTIRLALAAVIVATITGIIIGVISAVWVNTYVDRTLMLISVFGISAPVFWFGLMAIYIFSRLLGIFPPSGMRPYPPGDFIDSLPYLVLPALTLGLRSAAYIAQVTRSTMLEVLREDYIRTAKAKGLGKFQVIYRHGLRNALIPVITLIGLDLASYLNGSVITETIFGWPGIGKFVMDGILQRDYPVIMGGVLLGAFLFVLMNIVVDIIYGFLDPRIKDSISDTNG